MTRFSITLSYFCVHFAAAGADGVLEGFGLEKETSGNDDLLADLDSRGDLHQVTVAMA